MGARAIDQASADFTKMLRSPDVWFGDIRTEVVRGRQAIERRIDSPDRGVFVYLLEGSFELTLDGMARSSRVYPQDTAFGFESGRPHRWRSVPGDRPRATRQEQVALLISSIPQHLGVLRGLPDGMISLPNDAEPYARMVRTAVKMLLWEHENDGVEGDEAVSRRCAEICMIQFVRYARAQITDRPAVPKGLIHDEYLLRAWSAYFAEPRRRWTVAALASAAGLSRSVFAERFTKIFGAPPLHTLTMLRLEQAEQMLRNSMAPLIEIAFTVGYNSEAAFVRAFHRQYGMPPGRFRARHARDGK